MLGDEKSTKSWADEVEEEEAEHELQFPMNELEIHENEKEDLKLKEGALKLFVGQIPKELDEEKLKKFMEKYGKVKSVSVIKDKFTGESRGCAFVTFFDKKSADDAINFLHNQITLPPAKRPIQVKYAESEIETKISQKLFVGMLSPSANEDAIRKIFEPYGDVERISIIKDMNGNSKGCAFLWYHSKEQALSAITALNGVFKMEGSSMNLVVRFADTEEQKLQRKQKMPSSPINVPMTTYHTGKSFSSSSPRNFSRSPRSPNFFSSSPRSAPLFSSSPAGKLPLRGWNSKSSSLPKFSPTAGPVQDPDIVNCNLFVYNLPPFYDDDDLKSMFAPFGNVVSANVFINKQTGLSKGFGFVCYDSPESAEKAIAKLDGTKFQNKILQVRLKDSGEN